MRLLLFTLCTLLSGHVACAAFIDPYGSVNFWSNRHVNITNFALPNISGNVDVYTCPVGSMATITMIGISTNTASTITATNRIATNGVYTAFTVSTVSTNTVTGMVASPVNAILENETFALGLSGTLNVWVTVITWPVTIPIVAPRFYSLAAGTNLIYSIPEGVYAGSASLTSPLLGNNLTGFTYYNFSGNNREIKVYIVPRGGVIAFTNRIIDVTVTTGTAKTVNFQVLNPLDTIVLDVDSATATQAVLMSPFILRTSK